MIVVALLAVKAMGLDAQEAEAECMCAFAGVVGTAFEEAEGAAVSFVETGSDSAEAGAPQRLHVRADPARGDSIPIWRMGLSGRVLPELPEAPEAPQRSHVRSDPAQEDSIPIWRIGLSGRVLPAAMRSGAVDSEGELDTAEKKDRQAPMSLAFLNFQKEACGPGSTKETGMTTAKELLRKYGPAYLVTSVSIAAVSYGACYAAVAKGVDVAALLARMGLQAKVNEKVGRASIAYVAHKAASPLRFPPTVALTPYVAKTLFGKDGEE